MSAMRSNAPHTLPTGHHPRDAAADRAEDAYEAGKHHVEPTRCVGCGATYQHGRWTWRPELPGSVEATCPACRRIEDDYPAGILQLSGSFAAAHRAEIVGLIENEADAETAEHPLHRTMRIAEEDDGLTVTTTDVHLSRRALHRAYDGEWVFRYAEDDRLFRGHWSR